MTEYHNADPKPVVVLLSADGRRKLREQCAKRAHYRCEDCGRYVPLSSNSGDPLFTNGHMSHTIPRKRGGDILSNVKWKCFSCHIERGHIEGKK